jgi:hypothetical protein
MRYYLIKEAGEFKIMKVQDDCINFFLSDYSMKITFASDSLQTILQKINEFGPLAYKVKKASEGLRTTQECRFSLN